MPAPLQFNVLSDSILARSFFGPVKMFTGIPGVPRWRPGMRVYPQSIVQASNGVLYYSTVNGITGSVEPTHITGSAIDNGITWFTKQPFMSKDATSGIFWLEKFSNGAVVWEPNRAYASPNNAVYKVVPLTRGQGYQQNNTTIVFSAVGPRATAVVNPNDGGIDAVIMDNIGHFITGAITATVVSPTGLGATLTCVHTSSGTFGVSGTVLSEAFGRVDDAIAAKLDVLGIMLGTNDSTLIGVGDHTVGMATVDRCLNLYTKLYDKIAEAGIYPLIYTIPPKTALTGPMVAFRSAVTQFQRAYAQRERWANPKGYAAGIVDLSAWVGDGATGFNPFGGAAPVINGMTVEGTHPLTAMAQIEGYLAAQELKKIGADGGGFFPRDAQYAYGFDPTYCPQGNRFEGLPHQPNAIYALGAKVNADSGKLYRCTVAGQAGAASPPTGTGTAVDGAVTWTYERPSGFSLFNSGTTGTLTAAAGVVYTGTLATGMTLARRAGNAGGTVKLQQITRPGTGALKTTFQRIAFDLSGASTPQESWRLLIASVPLATLGISSADLMDKEFEFLVDMKVFGHRNAYTPCIRLFGPADVIDSIDGWGGVSSSGIFLDAGMAGTGYEMLPFVNGFFDYPNGGKMLYRTPRTKLPLGQDTVNLGIYFGFNASAAAVRAQLTADINYISFHSYRGAT